ICFDGGETLADAFAEFEYLWEDAENTPVWYDEETGGAVVPGSTKVEGGDEYYLDFDISGCDVRIPVKVDYTLDKPQAEMEQKFCSETALNLINIRDKEKLTDLDICGNSLKYYDENFIEIQNPGSTDLVDGAVYYITTSEN